VACAASLHGQCMLILPYHPPPYLIRTTESVKVCSPCRCYTSPPTPYPALATGRCLIPRSRGLGLGRLKQWSAEPPTVDSEGTPRSTASPSARPHARIRLAQSAQLLMPSLPQAAHF